MLTVSEKAQAISWYVNNISLSTIAQHFCISVESLKAQLNNVPH